MSRLTGYLTRLFALDALALLAVAAILLFLIQCLRIFDVVSVKGQGMLTLVGQGLLAMPPLVVVFLYVCMGIGLARALTALQQTFELHIIHVSNRVRALITAVMTFAIGGALLVSLLSHLVEPVSSRYLNDWSAQIAADIVSRTLTPHRFSQVMPGVVIVIGGRQGNGDIFDFFADDRRDPETRRTYFAKSAVVAATDEGYVLQMKDGSIQYLSATGEFSEVSFGTYDIDIARLTTAIDGGGSYAERDSFDLFSEGLRTGVWPDDMLKRLVDRASEALRVIGMCLLVAGIAAFPNGRRRKARLPLEVVVLVVAFTERTIGNYAPLPDYLRTLSGVTVLCIVGMTLLLIRLRVFTPIASRVATT